MRPDAAPAEPRATVQKHVCIVTSIDAERLTVRPGHHVRPTAAHQWYPPE
jgi:hypothetical protein